MKHNNILEKIKKNHFDTLKKNNAVTDAKNGELSLGAMKALDIILQAYQVNNSKKISMELSFLRKKLGLERNNDYVNRIKSYIMELKLPFELRDFNDFESGKRVEWALTSFLNDVKSYKDSQHLIEMNISDNFIEYMVEKAGYTNIDIELSKKFKTKYGYKIYEMYLRYYTMPNKKDHQISYIKKDINELNKKFGTNHKHKSKMFEGIKRGINEILKLTGEEVYCDYVVEDKKFMFYWMKNSEKIGSKCIIPNARINETIDWIILHTKKEIKNIKSYKAKIKALIKNNTFEDLESLYRGMMINKYDFTSEEINLYKLNNGKYKNFKEKKN